MINKEDFRKQHSREHEIDVANMLNGTRSPSSGASVREKGDVYTDNHVIECKLKGSPGKPAQSTIVKQMEKINNEALEIGKWPMLALRFYNPDSSLADHDGYIDLAVTLMDDIRLNGRI